MRQIQFRGRKVSDGKWVLGFYAEPTWCWHKFGKHNAWIITGAVSNGGYFNVTGRFAVENDTVGQYVGLCDTNGLKIFEGDVVRFTRTDALGWTRERVGVVKYYDRLPVFYILSSTGDAWDWVVCENITVIGNIHDNPELMKKEDDNAGL